MSEIDPNPAALVASEALVHALARPEAFPHAVDAIEILETHISWIVLTGRYAYKIKKPVDLGFLDFSTLDLRKRYCEEELRLNRRFAPRIYEDIVPIGGSSDAPSIGAEPILDWAVRMHEFPADARLDRQLAAGRISVEDMSALGESIARSHADSPVAPPDGEYGSVDAVRKPVMDNFVTLAHCRPEGVAGDAVRAALEPVEQWTRLEFERLGPIILERQRQGHVRECHGDLHLANLVRMDADIVAFDCLEFDARLRWIDVMSEVGFLVMDTMFHGRADLAYAFLNRYLEVSGDYAGMQVLRLYIVYRCLVRAKVAALLQAQSKHKSPSKESGRTVLRYLELAGDIANPDRKPILAITHGLSGSGKTFLSQGLMCRLPAIRVRSDIQRKRLHGINELGRSKSGIDTGLYTAEATQTLYETLRNQSALILRAGFDVIVDAANLKKSQRKLFIDLARQHKIPAVILACDASRATLADRIRRRTVEGTDASEADLQILEHQLASAEPLSPEEEACALHIDTSGDLSPDRLIDQIERARARS